MANLTLDKEITALLVIDPYNDFISKGGNFWPRTGHAFQGSDCVQTLINPIRADALVSITSCKLR